jgi:superkiller protein 3
LESGQLIEPTGQLCFDFDDEVDGQALCTWDPRTADEWFHIAIEAEDACDFARARDAYCKAVILDETDPVLRFNLGNVLYELNEFESAAAAFEKAVRLDSRYAEAWNNLGNVLAELGDREAAIAAFDHALALVPNYEDAKQNRFHVMGLSPLMQADLRLAGK